MAVVEFEEGTLRIDAAVLFIEHALIIAFVSYAALAGTSTIEEASKDS